MRDQLHSKESSALNLESGASATATFYFPRSAQLKRFGVMVTSAADANSAANVAFDHISFAGTNTAAIATIVIPASTAIRSVCYERDTAGTVIAAGSTINVRVPAEATNAMTGIAFVEFEYLYDAEANEAGAVSA